jgi:hypothetical protein
MIPDGKPDVKSNNGTSTSDGSAPKGTSSEKDAATPLRSGAGIMVILLATLALL